jgi:hypothetical protein
MDHDEDKREDQVSILFMRRMRMTVTYLGTRMKIIKTYRGGAQAIKLEKEEIRKENSKEPSDIAEENEKEV